MKKRVVFVINDFVLKSKDREKNQILEESRKSQDLVQFTGKNKASINKEQH